MPHLSAINKPEIDTKVPINTLELDFGLPVELRQSTAPQVEILGKSADHAKAVAIKQHGQALELSRQKTGLFNDLLFWKNNWPNLVLVRLGLPDIKNVTVTNGSTLSILEGHFDKLELTANNKGQVWLKGGTFGQLDLIAENGGQIINEVAGVKAASKVQMAGGRITE